jgi:hypothetical protein
MIGPLALLEATRLDRSAGHMGIEHPRQLLRIARLMGDDVSDGPCFAPRTGIRAAIRTATANGSHSGST